MTANSRTGSPLSAAILAAMLCVSAQAAIPPSVTELSGRHPAGADWVAYLKLDPALVAFAFDSIPMGDSYRKVFEDQCAAFEAKTGFNPMRDVLSVSMAGTLSTSGPSQSIGFVETGAKTAQLRDMLKKTLPPTEKWEGADRIVGPSGENLITAAGVIRGDPAEMKTLKEKAAPLAWLGEVEKTLPADPRFFLAAQIKPGLVPPGEGPQQMLAATRWISLSLDKDKFQIRFTFADPKAAEGIAGMANGIVQSALPGLQQAAEQADKNATSPIDLLSPDVLKAKASYLTAKRVVDAITVAPEGPAAVLTVSRDKLPPVSPQVVSLALVAGTVLVANIETAKAQAKKVMGSEGAAPAAPEEPAAPAAPEEAAPPADAAAPEPAQAEPAPAPAPAAEEGEEGAEASDGEDEEEEDPKPAPKKGKKKKSRE